MITKAARRRANRLLVLERTGEGVPRTSVMPRRGEWADLFAAPLFVREYDALATEPIRSGTAHL